MLRKIERHKGNRFAKSVSIYAPLVIIINHILDHNSRSIRKHDWEDSTTTHMVSQRATHGIGQDGSTIVKSKVKTETGLNSGGLQTLTSLWNSQKVFPVEKFKATFIEWVICDNIKLRQSVSQRLRKMFALVDKATGMVLPQSHNTTRRWIMTSLAKQKIIVRSIIGQSGSRISICFDAWRSNSDLSLLGVVAHFLTGDTHELKTLLLALPEIKNYSREEQACVLAEVLKDYEIDAEKLGWFVLDNASNNDTALSELSKSILFDPLKK